MQCHILPLFGVSLIGLSLCWVLWRQYRVSKKRFKRLNFKVHLRPAWAWTAGSAWGRCHKTFFLRHLRSVKSALECLALATLNSQVKCLRVWPTAYPKADSLKYDLTLLINVGLGSQGLPRSNTLAYFLGETVVKRNNLYKIGRNNVKKLSFLTNDLDK